jgi:hypothetical protein
MALKLPFGSGCLQTRPFPFHLHHSQFSLRHLDGSLLGIIMQAKKHITCPHASTFSRKVCHTPADFR